MGNPIKFLFLPASGKTISKDGSGYAIEKAAGDKIHRYLCGISSGIKIDGHGDRMSEACVRDFMEQLKVKDVPLYVNHGRDYTRDIGLLEKAELTENNDWYTEYRLYDDTDNVPEQDKQEALKVWLQANGLPPYKRKRQFGFSIEGVIPNGGYEATATGKIINKVDLDPGVSLVSKPAYSSSVATAIEKSLKTQKDVILDILQEREKIQDYFDEKWKLETAFQEAADEILNSDASPEEKTQSLTELFDSLKAKLIPVLLSRPALQGGDASPPAVAKSMVAVCSDNLNILKKITKEVNNMEDAKTLLMEAISSLQMLLQAMSENAPAEEIEAKKAAVNAAVKKAEEAAKTEDTPMEEETIKALSLIKGIIKKEDPKTEDTPEVAAAKRLLAAKASLSKKQQDEIAAELAAAEKILREDAKGVDEQTPEQSLMEDEPQSNLNALEELAKNMGLQKSMASILKKQSEEISTMKAAMNELLTGFGVVEKRGLSGSGGQEQILKQLQDSLEKLTTKTEKTDLPSNENYVKKHASAFAEFLTKGR